MKNTDNKKLCYIDNNRCAYFTSFPLSKVYGDDWNDAPYELNAGPPYEEFDITKIFFTVDLYQLPLYFGEYSIDEINNKKNKIPWLKPVKSNKSITPIFADITLGEFKKLIRKHKGKIYIEEVN